ncbi:VRR-NUC domain-containing protein [uncultured Deinococcus sp.]|uniref:VRR-NUC domain-containing protein n=1 Tax=uncultured Deinococcus sp. TaxID=158789 RepID=UPI00258A4288|nr:VRR-NUC domain-containing protein [uncultured Deinococcus sp.]
MTEAQLQARVRHLLVRFGWYVVETDRASLGRSRKRGGVEVGFPDLLALRGDRFVLIELKTKDGRVSEEQAALHARFRALGIAVHTCRSEEQVLAVIRPGHPQAAPVEGDLREGVGKGE